MISTRLPYSGQTSHYCILTVHETLADLRRTLRKRGYKTTDTVGGCCWQTLNFDYRDPVIAEIHLAKDNYDLFILAHECTHAAMHRQCVAGCSPDGEAAQEILADDVATLIVAAKRFMSSGAKAASPRSGDSRSRRVARVRQTLDAGRGRKTSPGNLL